MNEQTQGTQVERLKESLRQMTGERNILELLVERHYTERISKQWILNWLINQIDMEVSCVEDLEMTEGIKNDYGRGKIDAWSQLFKEIQEGE